MIFKAILVNKTEIWLSPEEYKKVALAISRGVEFVALEKEVVNTKYIVHLSCEKDDCAPAIEEQKSLEDIKAFFKKITKTIPLLK